MRKPLVRLWRQQNPGFCVFGSVSSKIKKKVRKQKQSARKQKKVNNGVNMTIFGAGK